MSDQIEIVVDGIPFFSQIIEKSNISSEGPSEEETRHWSVRACGIACVRMLVMGAKQLSKEPFEKTTWQLLNEGIQELAYCDKGWIHAGLLRVLDGYGISGRCHRGVSVNEMGDIIRRENVCIASVSVGLRGGETSELGKIIGKGGHLIIFHGVRENHGEIESLRCHHPSSTPSWNWENYWVPLEKVERSFSGNLIEIDWRDLGHAHMFRSTPVLETSDEQDVA